MVSKKRCCLENKYLYRDLCTLALIAVVTFLFYIPWKSFIVANNQTGHLTGTGNIGMALVIYAFLYLIMGRWLHGFTIGVDRKANVLAGQVLTLFTLDICEVFISCAITGQFRFFLEFIRIYYLMFMAQALITGLLIVLMISIYRKNFPPIKIIEIYGEHSNDLYRKINSLTYKYDICALLSCDESDEMIREKITSFDAVLINDLPAQKENNIIKICFELDKRVYLVPKISDILVKNSEEINLFDTPLFLNRNAGMRRHQKFVKRMFDVVLSGLALVILSPVFILTALAIHFEDHGPVFFKQERVTLGGRHFMILKFRSMIVDAEKDGRPHPAGEKDDRITKVGSFIRACRIDELPQLINILKGDMSIVGPRPERWEHCEKYSEEIPEWNLRNKVRGGLTGYAQVYGKYNTTALDKLKLDLIYITNYSFLLDLQIIFQTVKILLQKESTEGFSESQISEMHDDVQLQRKSIYSTEKHE